MAWKEFVEAVGKTSIEFPHLKIAMLSQSILETGRGITDVFNQCKNPAGMKYRPEMEGYATPKYVKTDSEPSGGSDFCSFETYESAVKGYWRFLERSPYAGWKNKSKTAIDFLAFIGPIWCPAGYTDSWIKAHGNKNYHQYIINNLYQEAEQLLKEVSVEPEITWFERNRNDKGETVITAYAGGDAKYLFTSDDIAAQRAFENNFPKAKTSKVAPAGKPVLTNLPEYNRGTTPVEPVKPTGKKVLLDPGHSETHPGARGLNSSVQEEDLNRFQAQLLKAELEKMGISATIIDPEDDDLYAIGQAAKGYDAFVSLHLNAYKNKEFYTCTMCHPSKQSPSSLSAKVASEWAQAVAEAIGNPLFSGTAGWPKGVMATGLSVLSGAASVNSPLFFLSELEFIDDESSDVEIKKRIEKGIKAGAKVLAKALGVTADPTPTPNPNPQPSPSEVVLKLTRTGKTDSVGCKELKLEFVGTGEFLLVRSGLPANQFFRKSSDPQALPGSCEPLPQPPTGQYYKVGDIEWAGGKDNYDASHGDAYGPLIIDLAPTFSMRRSGFLIHFDGNVPGTAGCVGIPSKDLLKKLVSLLRKYDPKKLFVDYGL